MGEILAYILWFIKIGAALFFRVSERISPNAAVNRKWHEAFGADTVGGMPDQEQRVLDFWLRLGVGEGAEGLFAPLLYG
jgi:hypothetical protein